MALALAHTCLTVTAPNPRVGCVLTSPVGDVIGAGHTQQAGGPHAEVMALRDAEARLLSLADYPMHFPVDDMQISEDLQCIVCHMLTQYLFSVRDKVQG